MGEVWEAEQRHPIRRRVAVKLLKLGMDTKAFLARFEIERQALAVMDHPNIAKVFDAGADARGRPFYVMELVAGVPITEFCDDRRLSTRERLELFVDVCRGVQHAHQKAVIHRDLKPSNVLVALHDDRPVPKIIDFGIAKATGSRMTDVTFATEAGRPIGTPAYMSPEQWEAGPLDVDTRTDIYSLGVLLYELLVGQLPVDPKRLRAAGAAVAGVLRDSTPQAPSARLTAPETDPVSLARARRTDPRSLKRELRGDLDWITLKALEPDRTRRYETPHALLQDIIRHLRAEPVAARPPSPAYQLNRFVRRNRVAVVGVAATIVALAAFTVTTSLQARRLADERDRARRESERATALNTFLRRTILSVDPVDGIGRNVTMLQALDSARARLESEPPAQPEVASALEDAVGWAYYKLGEGGRAEPLVRRAYARREAATPVDSAALLESATHLAALHQLLARPDSAAQLYTLAISLARQTRTGDDSDLAGLLVTAGGFLRERGDTAGARAAFTEGRALFERAADSLGMAFADGFLGLLEHSLGHYDRALALHEQSARVRRARMGEHAIVAEGYVNIGAALEELDRPAAAESAYREAIRIGSKALGEDHWLVTGSMNNLGLLLSRDGNSAEAEQLLRRALAADEKAFGADHPNVAIGLVNLTRIVCTSDPDGGVSLARRAVGIFAKHFPPESGELGEARLAVGRCLTKARRYGLAEPELVAALRILRGIHGPTHARVDSARARLRDLYAATGRPALADSIMRAR